MNRSQTIPYPLDDPNYSPRYPPLPGGYIPDVVSKWGPRSQRRWFRRYRGKLAPLPHGEWARFYVDSEVHRGLCCSSCLGDQELGYESFGYTDANGVYLCCCHAWRELQSAPLGGRRRVPGQVP